MLLTSHHIHGTILLDNKKGPQKRALVLKRLVNWTCLSAYERNCITMRQLVQTRVKLPCIRPAHNHLLMVHIESTEQIITDSSPEGLCFNASYIHAISGEPIREVEVHLQPDQRVYFVASQHPHWYYVVQWSGYFGRFGCSCLTGKLFNQTRVPCEHMGMVAREVM